MEHDEDVNAFSHFSVKKKKKTNETRLEKKEQKLVTGWLRDCSGGRSLIIS